MDQSNSEANSEVNLEVSLQEANPDSGAQTPAEADVAEASGAPSTEGIPNEELSSAKPKLLARARALLKDLLESLFSSDGATRRTAFLFFAGLIGVTLISIASVKRIAHIRAERALAAKERELEEKRLQEIQNSRLADLKFAENTVSLGRYVVSLKRNGRDAPKADFELFVRCNEKEVREYIEARTVQVRSELTSALVGMNREDFLAVDGKRRTHKKILLIINQWLAREYSGARIEDAWFSDLVVE